MRTAQTVNKIHRHDGRIKTGCRLCCICGQPLTRYNKQTLEPIVIKDYYNCRMSEIVTLTMCLDIRSCKSFKKER